MYHVPPAASANNTSPYPALAVCQQQCAKAGGQCKPASATDELYTGLGASAAPGFQSALEIERASDEHLERSVVPTTEQNPKYQPTAPSYSQEQEQEIDNRIFQKTSAT